MTISLQSDSVSTDPNPPLQQGHLRLAALVLAAAAAMRARQRAPPMEPLAVRIYTTTLSSVTMSSLVYFPPCLVIKTEVIAKLPFLCVDNR